MGGLSSFISDFWNYLNFAKSMRRYGRDGIIPVHLLRTVILHVVLR